MAKTTKNKQSLSQNILALLTRLHEKDLIEEFAQELSGEGNKGMLRMFRKLITEETAIEDIPSDAELESRLVPKTKSFTDKRQDFYDRIINFAGRAINNQEEWYKNALKILSDVDALWELNLKDQAEMQFIKIYKIFPQQVPHQKSAEYSYGLSKIFYYGSIFFTHYSHLSNIEVHQDFFEKEEFHFIRELEFVAGRLDIKKPIYGNVEKWKTDHAVFRFFNVLASIAKQKKDFSRAKNILERQSEHYAELASNFLFREEHGHRSFNFFSDYEPQDAAEMEVAFYYYLKMEEFQLCILDGDPFRAEMILTELYRKLNSTFDKSKNYLVGLILFLRLELEQSQYAISPIGKDIEFKKKDFINSFFAAQTEVSDLIVRLELNKFIFDFLASPDRVVYDKVKIQIKTLESTLKEGIHYIKLDLAILKLFACIEGNRTDDMEDIIRSVKKHAKDSNRNSEFLKKFILRIRKINLLDWRKLKEEFPLLAQELEGQRNPQNHLDNLIIFWLNLFASRKSISRLG